jgi:hypothetical protein
VDLTFVDQRAPHSEHTVRTPHTTGQSLIFLQTKEAYDVLSDPKRRRLYDELGASGLRLLESPQSVNPVELIKNFQVCNGTESLDRETERHKHRGQRRLDILLFTIFAFMRSSDGVLSIVSHHHQHRHLSSRDRKIGGIACQWPWWWGWSSQVS